MFSRRQRHRADGTRNTTPTRRGPHSSRRCYHRRDVATALIGYYWSYITSLRAEVSQCHTGRHTRTRAMRRVHAHGLTNTNREKVRSKKKKKKKQGRVCVLVREFGEVTGKRPDDHPLFAATADGSWTGPDRSKSARQEKKRKEKNNTQHTFTLAVCYISHVRLSHRTHTTRTAFSVFPMRTRSQLPILRHAKKILAAPPP